LAGAHLAAAAKYTAIAAAWGSFAAVAGGGGGSGGGAPTVGRDRAGVASERAEVPGAELHITFVGDGFTAVNPVVQDVVTGSIENAKERTGPNAKVHTYRRTR